jgi:CheY-like chemotaxis protein
MSHSRILVVDDEEGIRQLFVDILVPKGYEVVVAASGHEALERAREAAFDVVFLDIKMPGMNGVEAFEALREINPRSQYVMITGYAGSDLVDQSLAGGALLCLNKPFGVADVLDLVRSLERQSAQVGSES